MKNKDKNCVKKRGEYDIFSFVASNRVIIRCYTESICIFRESNAEKQFNDTSFGSSEHDMLKYTV